ncbi:N-acetylmuramoyl-L-alanine amidase [Actinophytocola sp.]|uniref:N-acetylmuramoyl-L-alanine amidase n=1 Tax=Actinophytocola sp. TaxID=1872138 RepID=UPI002D7F2147|nr:N-acetylmuramoyl-L-alanine amidase [Actinophytocola sp.]HET9138247.1 N-acetylmuramoyl-L-alanine amidase [Actinophytocola sp.]
MRWSVWVRGGLVAALVVSGAVLTAPGATAAPPDGSPPAAPGATVPLRSAPADAATGARTVHTAAPFAMVGVRWAGVAPDRIEVRSRTVAGKWSEWTALEPSDAQPERNRASTTTEPLWTGPSQDVQVRAYRSGQPVTDGLELVTVDPGSRPADARLSGAGRAASAQAAGRPAVVSRAQWGADERLMTWAPEYASATKAVTIHHTAGTNTYSCADSAAIVRGIYQYHAVTNGWGDIGYNVLVDSCGTIFEGRTGGLDVPTIGAHAGGFNQHTFGIALMGDFSNGTPTDPALESVSAMAAWKLATSYRDVRGSTVLVSTGGGTSRYPAGTAVTVPNLFAHRDVGNTACPGDSVYNRLEQIRSRVQTLAGDWRSSPVYQKWVALGGESGPLGGVYQQEQDLPGGGRGAYFAGSDGVTITSSAAAGTHFLRGPIQRAWVAMGGAGWSYPTTDELAVPGKPGLYNDFLNGSSIYWSAAGGAHAVGGAIKTWWVQGGGAAGRYGLPYSDEFAFDGGTRRQDFTTVTVIYNPATGQFRTVPHRTPIGGGWRTGVSAR